MLVTRLNIIQHVLKILLIETEVHQLLLYKGIDFVRNIIYSNQNTY